MYFTVTVFSPMFLPLFPPTPMSALFVPLDSFASTLRFYIHVFIIHTYTHR